MLHLDPDLLQAYRNGETRAYETLYRHYVPSVAAFLRGGFSFTSQGKTCRYRGGHYGVDVDGVVQETFARAFSETTRRNYDGERPFKNYLFSIAKNLVLRELQRRERLISVDPQADDTTDYLASRSPLEGLTSIPGSPERAVADEQLSQIIREFVAGLGTEETTFFSQRFAQGMTQEATAETMGVTRARVKLLEKNLRRRFLDALRNHGYFVGYTPKPRWARQSNAA